MRRLRSAAWAATVAAIAAPLLAAGPVPVAADPVPRPVAGPMAAQPPVSTPFATPDTSACPYRRTPPPAVDLSEVPAPGEPTPTALPVRRDPVGGPRLAGCGLVLPEPAPPLPADLSAHAWLVADLDSGAVLAARDPHARHRPASAIKVLTALVALRELDLATEVVATDADANQEGSRVGIGPTGRYTVGQLLYGLLLRSGNDAAHALAGQLGGVPATVARMNQLARQLGALDTRAATPSGLDAPGSSTSAYDLAVIFRVAMRQPVFASMIGTTQIDFPGFLDKPGFKVGNDNRLLANYPGALGGKTGFTDDARHTYLGAAERGGRRLLVVLMRGEQRPVPMWEQAARLLDYGFALPATTPAVGTLVDAAPAAAPAAPTTTASLTGGPSAGATAAAQGTGNGTGGAGASPGLAVPVTLAATVLVAVALVAVLRYRRRSAARPAPADDTTPPF